MKARQRPHQQPPLTNPQPPFLHFPSIWSLARVGHIEEICIAPSHQGTGLGKAIIKALDSIAIREGCRRSMLDCSLDKTEFYMKLGYKTTGIQMARKHVGDAKGEGAG